MAAIKIRLIAVFDEKINRPVEKPGIEKRDGDIEENDDGVYQLSIPIGTLKRQRAGALQNLSDFWAFHDSRQRLGVRQPSGAFHGFRDHGSSSSQPLQQLPMNPAKPSVAEHADDVAALNVFGDVMDDRVHIRQIRGAFP